MTKGKQPCRITLLDGGMGRELKRMGAPFRQPEWSALALMEAPELVRKAHGAFAAAGSDILTTSNYAVTPFHIGETRFWNDGARLTSLSARLAREAAQVSGCLVAGSLPPLFGSYRPDLFDAGQAPAMLKLIVEALSSQVDLWLAETVSSTEEAATVAAAITGEGKPLWISYTLGDAQESRLRSGETVADAVKAAVKLDASAILFNCSQPETMATAISTTIGELKNLHTDIPVGVYANAFPALPKDTRANAGLNETRRDLEPAEYLNFVEGWCNLGATIIGGCCGIGPEHIAAIHKAYRTG